MDFISSFYDSFTSTIHSWYETLIANQAPIINHHISSTEQSYIDSNNNNNNNISFDDLNFDSWFNYIPTDK